MANPSSPRLHGITLERLRAEKARRKMIDFIAPAWEVLEPATKFRSNWHIDAICDHLEAVSRGDITNLIIEVPPGHMKSLLTSVIWPAWEWIQAPHLRWLYASYSQMLSLRDSRKTNELIKSEWYQRHFSEEFKISKESEILLMNDKTGFRFATSVGGMGTGERVHRAVHDDLLRANDAHSEAIRGHAIEHMRAMSTRGVDPELFRQVLIMQRLHEMDPAGWAKETGGWECLTLPAEFEEKRRCRTSIGFVDPRIEEGDLLWPKMYPQTEIERLKITLGPYGASAQLQQSPSPGKGGLIKPEKFEIVESMPWDIKWVRSWDLAGSETNKADWTATVRIGRDSVNRIFICEVIRFKSSGLDVEVAVKNTAKLDGIEVPITMAQDPGQAGKQQANYYTTQVLIGYDLTVTPETGSKVTRAQPFANQVEAGNVYLLKGPWIEKFKEECRTFPLGAHDDQVDAATRGFNFLFGDAMFESKPVVGSLRHQVRRT